MNCKTLNQHVAGRHGVQDRITEDRAPRPHSIQHAGCDQEKHPDTETAVQSENVIIYGGERGPAVHH